MDTYNDAVKKEEDVLFNLIGDLISLLGHINECNIELSRLLACLTEGKGKDSIYYSWVNLSWFLSQVSTKFTEKEKRLVDLVWAEAKQAAQVLNSRIERELANE